MDPTKTRIQKGLKYEKIKDGKRLILEPVSAKNRLVELQWKMVSNLDL